LCVLFVLSPPACTMHIIGFTWVVQQQQWRR